MCLCRSANYRKQALIISATYCLSLSRSPVSYSSDGFYSALHARLALLCPIRDRKRRVRACELLSSRIGRKEVAPVTQTAVTDSSGAYPARHPVFPRPLLRLFPGRFTLLSMPQSTRRGMLSHGRRFPYPYLARRRPTYPRSTSEPGLTRSRDLTRLPTWPTWCWSAEPPGCGHGAPLNRCLDAPHPERPQLSPRSMHAPMPGSRDKRAAKTGGFAMKSRDSRSVVTRFPFVRRRLGNRPPRGWAHEWWRRTRSPFLPRNMAANRPDAIVTNSRSTATRTP